MTSSSIVRLLNFHLQWDKIVIYNTVGKTEHETRSDPKTDPVKQP